MVGYIKVEIGLYLRLLLCVIMNSLYYSQGRFLVLTPEEFKRFCEDYYIVSVSRFVLGYE